ncbi:MAG TPA: hypothetical protein VHB21_24020 [Minicystis sp.]|nr:hypothetical protein [Minicystis sp.]
MKDEWSEWKEAWDAGARSLPEIQAMAEKQRRRMILGVAGMWAIGACLVVGSVVSAFADPNWVSVVNALFQCVVVTSMLTFSHVLMWGNWREANETPDAVLALMERRWVVRRRLASFVRWGGAACCAFVFLFCLAAWLSIPDEPAWVLAGQTAFVLAIGAFFWFVSKRQYAKIDAALAELAEQRRLLRESDPSLGQA